MARTQGGRVRDGYGFTVVLHLVINSAPCALSGATMTRNSSYSVGFSYSCNGYCTRQPYPIIYDTIFYQTTTVNTRVQHKTK